MHKIVSTLKKAKTIALFSHVSPDPDTVGSTLALKLALEKQGKKVEIFCDSETFDDYKFLHYADCYNKSNLEGFDLFVAVDVASNSMLGKFEKNFIDFENTLKIDHHGIGNDYARINYVAKESACALVVFDIIKALKVKIDSFIATCLYFGICGDTGVFRNSNTDSKTFSVCSELLSLGADHLFVYREFFDKRTVGNVLLTSNAVLNAEINDKEKFVVMTVSREDFEKFKTTENESLGNVPKVFLNCGYKIAVILKQKEDGIHCSFRSLPEYDVSGIAAVFGGGGHKNASGCTIVVELKKAKKMVESEIKKYLKEVKV